MEKRLSIIIPAYITSEKGAKDLWDLIKKLQKQAKGIRKLIDLDLHEIFVVNDGSPVVLMKPEDLDYTGITFYVNEHNGGVAEARNIGIEYTTGQYIVFIDADDDVPNDFVHILDNRIALELVNGEQFDIIQFKARHGDGNIAYPEPCAWGKLIKRSWIGKDRFDPDQLIGEEDTLFHKEEKEAKIAFDERIIYYHRPTANPDSLMKRFWRGEIPRRRMN